MMFDGMGYLGKYATGTHDRKHVTQDIMDEYTRDLRNTTSELRSRFNTALRESPISVADLQQLLLDSQGALEYYPSAIDTTCLKNLAAEVNSKIIELNKSEFEQAEKICREAKQAIKDFCIPSMTNNNSQQSLAWDDLTQQLIDDNVPSQNQENKLQRQRDAILRSLEEVKPINKRAIYLIVEMKLVFSYLSTQTPTSRDFSASLEKCSNIHLNTYSKEEWEHHLSELKSLHNDAMVSVEVQCWAKLMRAKVLLLLSSLYSSAPTSPLRANNLNQSSKAQELCLQLPEMLSEKKCCNAEAIEIIEDALQFSIIHSFYAEFIKKLRELRSGHLLLIGLQDAFEQGDFNKTMQFAEMYIKRNRSEERIYRHYARYLFAVAQYHVYLNNEEKVKKTKVEEAFLYFISHYKDNYNEFICGENLHQYAHAYFFSLQNETPCFEIDNIFVQTGKILSRDKDIIPWRLDFNTVFTNRVERMSAEALHPGLTSAYVQTINESHVLTSTQVTHQDESTLWSRSFYTSADSNTGRVRSQSGTTIRNYL